MKSDLDVTATLTPSAHRPGGRPVGWWCELDDPASPIAGLTAAGPSSDAAVTALAREVWSTVLDGSAGVDPAEVEAVAVAAVTRTRVPRRHLASLRATG